MFRDGRLADAQLRGSRRESPAASERRKGAQTRFEFHNFTLYECAYYVFLFVSRSCVRCRRFDMGTQDMQRRALLWGTIGAATVAVSSAQSLTRALAHSPRDHAPPGPLVWPAPVNPPS